MAGTKLTNLPGARSIERRLAGISLTLTVAYVFLGSIVFFLVAQFVQTIYPIFRTAVAPLEERRSADPFPSLHLLRTTTGDFAAGLNKWFDDRVGFRDLSIRAKNQIDYSIFDTSQKVWVGSDGWLFYRGLAHPVASLRPDQLSQLEQTYVTFAEVLSKKSIKLIVVGYPDKSAIYPENTPPQMPLMNQDGNYAKFRQFLANRSDLIFIDAQQYLQQEKSTSREQLYSKGDMHVNQYAQVPIVETIVTRIAQMEGRSDITWNEHFTLDHIWGGGNGSEARALALLFPRNELLPYFKKGYQIGGQEQDGIWFVPDRRVFESADQGVGRPFDWEFQSRPDLCPQLLPGMVLFGNSFSDLYWTLGLHRYFCFIRRAREPLNRLKLFVETIPSGTKYFIYEYYEPWLLNDYQVLGEIPPLR